MSDAPDPKEGTPLTLAQLEDFVEGRYDDLLRLQARVAAILAAVRAMLVTHPDPAALLAHMNAVSSKFSNDLSTRNPNPADFAFEVDARSLAFLDQEFGELAALLQRRL